MRLQKRTVGQSSSLLPTSHYDSVDSIDMNEWPDRRPSLSKERKPTPTFSKKSVLFVVVSLCVAGFYLYRNYFLHIEVQVYSTDWFRNTFQSTPPLSPSCFSPSTIAKSSYNSTLAYAPKYIHLSPGMALQTDDDCFDFARSLPAHPPPNINIPKHTIYHTYWRADLLPIGKRHVSLIHSILATQPAASTSLILWTNISPARFQQINAHFIDPIQVLYKKRFEIRKINKPMLARGTPMENHQSLETVDPKAWVDGDLVRLLLLWNYGGVWVDMDSLFTGRDMSVLLEHEWVTQWDCYNKPHQALNGALMHFLQHSPFICEMLYTISTDPPPRKGTTDWGGILYQKVWKKLIHHSIPPFKVLPWCFADPRSCTLSNRLPDPFAGDFWDSGAFGSGRGKEGWERLGRKVKSVWVVHLHNQWKKEFESTGWVRRLILDEVGERVREYRRLAWEAVSDSL